VVGPPASNTLWSHVTDACATGSREVLPVYGDGRTVRFAGQAEDLFEHLGVYRVLLGGSGPRHHLDFVEQALRPLTRYDTEHGTELVATLRGYFEADFNAAEAARRLYVHGNTLAYRLRIPNQMRVSVMRDVDED